MDDFLGTSIQYSELQILRLEKEYAAKQEKIVEELISSGFLDSDYDESTENESTETEFTDNENESFEIVDDNKYSDSPIIESLNDLNMMISPKSLNGPNDSSSSLTPTPSDVIITSPSNNNNNNNDILVSASDISVVDESIVSNSESINDALQPRMIFVEEEKINQEDEEIVDDIQEYDIITSKAIIRFMEFVFSDVKYLMILFILMVAMPIFEQQQQQQQEGQMNDRFEMYGGVHYNNYKRCGGRQSQENEFLYETSINFYMEPITKTQAIVNEEDDEKDEYQDNDDNNNQCKNHQQHILSFDIMTTAFDLTTKELRGARLLHHEFKFNPSDLLSTCNDNDDNINNNDNDNNNNVNMRNWRMRIRENIPIPHDMPRLFLMATNGVKPQMMRIFKETMSDTVGSQFGRSHGLYAMVMAFVGIAGFAAANGVDELITIS